MANPHDETISLRHEPSAMHRVKSPQPFHLAGLRHGASPVHENAGVIEVCGPGGPATDIFGTLQLAFRYSLLAPAREADGTPTCMSMQCLRDLSSSCQCNWGLDADAVGEYSAQANDASGPAPVRLPEGPQVQLHALEPS